MNIFGFLKEKKISKAKEDTSGAFLWFNRDVISRGGYPFFGRFIYENLLPFFRVRFDDIRQKGVMPPGVYGFYDGRALPQGQIRIPVQSAEQAAVLREAQFNEFSAVYVVAIFAWRMVDFTPLDHNLRNMLGYIGMTTCDHIGYREFDQLTGQLALPFTIKMTGELIIDEGLGMFLEEDELRAMGFLYRSSSEA